ncbi:MAG: DUF1653 domain-containing protein [Lachnospiraceae bacterium]|nr:DUF1653 domain-containing protein [Lachnospiraceae bacterium]
METNIPAAGEFYRHFKGNLYQIKMLAKDSETGKDLVVYQGMYPPFTVWVRPLSMFMGSVDRTKYPKATQNMRFVRVNPEKISYAKKATPKPSMTVNAHPAGKTPAGEKRESAEQSKKVMDNSQTQEVSDAELRKALESGQPERYLAERMTEGEIAHRGMLQILDADSFRERRQLLIGLRPYIDKLLLHNIAAALDVVLEEAPLEDQFESLLHCVDAHAKYEGGRLR